MLTIPKNSCQKSWSIYIQRRWKRLYQRITVQLTNLLQLFCPVLLPQLAKSNLSGPNHVIQFFSSWCQFSNSGQIKLFSIGCLGLHFGELWRLILQVFNHKHFLYSKMFGCCYGHLGIGFKWFLNSMVICTGNKWWWGTHRQDTDVHSIGCGAKCEYKDVAQEVGTTILFHRIHSGD